MNQSDENLNAPISGQFKSSPFYVAIGAPALAVALDILAAFVCHLILPPDVAKEQMSMITPMLLISGGGGSVTGIGAMMKRSLDITAGKIASQSAPVVPETINAGGDVNLGQKPQPQADNRTLVEELQPMWDADLADLNPTYIDQTPKGPEGNDFP